MSQLIASNYLNKLWITFSSEDSGASSVAGRPSPIGIDHECYRKMENGDRSVAYQQPKADHYERADEIAKAKWKTGKS